jgi:hypothetical protein
MEQLILHLFGDYVTQSDWMASEKTKSSIAAGAHALVYSLPFLLLTESLLMPRGMRQWMVILVTHFLIDRFRLARYVVYAKNWIAPTRYWYAWVDCAGTGYHADRPAWLAVWLMIAADNTLHLAINYVAIAKL